MQLALVDDEGHIVDAIDTIEEYNLDKPTAVASIIEDVRRMIAVAERQKKGHKNG